MTKLIVLGAAVVVVSSLAGPAMAQRATFHPAYDIQSNSCVNMEPGNPYNKDEDFFGWSAWRVRGGWDDHNDWRCMQSGRPHHHETGF